MYVISNPSQPHLALGTAATLEALASTLATRTEPNLAVHVNQDGLSHALDPVEQRELDELVQAAIDWAREQGLHKLCLEVFPHNTAAIALYRSAGFAEEGRRVNQYRRASGALWDSVVMGLVL